MRFRDDIKCRSVRNHIAAVFLTAVFLVAAQATLAQTIGFERARGNQMLDMLKIDIKKIITIRISMASISTPASKQPTTRSSRQARWTDTGDHRPGACRF